MKIKSRMAGLAFWFCISSQCVADQTSSAQTLSIEPSALLEQSSAIIQDYVKAGWFSGNLLIANERGQKVLKSYGYANKAAGIKNQACTRFNIGSIAKIYTAVLVLQYIESGELTLDTTLAETGLDLDPVIAKKVTIGHLLKHQAGFSDIFVPEYMDNPLKYDTLDKKVALLRNKPLLFEPGTDRRYSNYGYILLGAALESLSGKTFGTLLHDNIFVPVQAKTASLHRLEGDTCQSERYVFNLEQIQERTEFREVSGPDGGIEATVDDVLQFFRVLFFTDRLLERRASSFTWYFGDKPHFGAYGGGTGVSAAVDVLQNKKLVIVSLANSDELVAERISNRIVALANNTESMPFALPAKHFVYQQYQTLGNEGFKARFAELYKQHGYTSFMGKAINEAGLSLARAGKVEPALAIVGFLEHFYPTAPQAYDSLAYVYYLNGDEVNAKREFERALSFKADFNSDYHSMNYGLRDVKE